MKNTIVYSSIAVIAYGIVSCGKSPNSDDKAAHSENSQITRYLEKDPMFKDANRKVAGAPPGVWQAFYKGLQHAMKITDQDDQMTYLTVLRAVKKKTLNVKQPYESIIFSTKKLMAGEDVNASLMGRDWVLPLYDRDEIIDSWGINTGIIDGKDDGNWHVGIFGASNLSAYVEFEKQKGYWLSNYRKIQIESFMGTRFVGYIEKGKGWEDGFYYKHREPMKMDSTLYSLKNVLDQLCEDVEGKKQRLEMGNRLKGKLREDEMQNEK